MLGIKDKRLLYGLAGIAICLNIYFRLYTLFMPSSDEIMRQKLYNGARQDLSREMSLRYPEMPDKAKNKLVDKLFDDYIENNKQEIRRAVREKSKERNAYYQDERGWTYLLETDSYRWLRRIENYLDTGQFGVRHNDNQEYDDLEFAPYGDKIEPTRLFFYSGAYFYKLLHMINRGLSLENCLSLFPVILSAVLVSAVFWVCILFGISYWGGFLASLVVGLSPWVLIRTSFGWFDTDIYNLFMPLIIICVAACAFRRHKIIDRAVLIIAAGALLGVYSSLWSVWWMFFYILFAGICVYELSIIVNDRQRDFFLKIRLFLGDIFLFTAAVYLSVFAVSGPVVVRQSFYEPFSYFFIRDSLTIDNFWPNIAFSVAELGPAGIPTIISYMGGGWIFYGGLLGILIMSILQKKEIGSKYGFLQFALFVWMAAASILTFFSRRFVLFLVPPLTVFFCAGLDVLAGFIDRKRRLVSRKDKWKYGLLLIAVFLSAAVVPVYNAHRQSLFPNAPFLNNDSWQNMLAAIKKDAPADAIINTSWTPGDLVMSVGKRATVQDAHWQYDAVFFWSDYALLSDNEEEAFGIIRMINSGRNSAYEELLKIAGSDKLVCFGLIKEMAVSSEENSRGLLSKYTADKHTVDRIIKSMYGGSRPVYLLIHNKMAGELSIFSAVGRWDFKKSDLWRRFFPPGKNGSKRDFIDYAENSLGYSAEEAERLYTSFIFTDKADNRDWISSPYEFYTGYSERFSSGSGGKILMFDNGISVDKDNLEAYLFDRTAAKWISAGEVIFVDKKGAIKEKTNRQGDMRYSVLFSEEGDTCKAVMFSRLLAQSIFFKLYFLNGRGLKHFQLIKREYHKDSGTDIYLYKVIK